MPRTVPFIQLLALVALLLPPTAPVQLQAQTLDSLDPAIFDAMEYRHIGPVGNRVSAVGGVPGDPNIYYIGAASGGIFKSVDGGIHWEPVFDDQPVASIGSLAIDPVNPNVIWAGTGETFIRSNISHGNGIYKSTDAGKTWRHLGLDATGHIGRIVIHPTDPDTVFAAAMGHGYGPQPERGVFRTTDGGETWERVLFVDEHTGASGHRHGPEQPANPLRRHVAAGHLDVGPRERRAGQRNMDIARRRGRPGKSWPGTACPRQADSARSGWR